MTPPWTSAARNSFDAIHVKVKHVLQLVDGFNTYTLNKQSAKSITTVKAAFRSRMPSARV